MVTFIVGPLLIECGFFLLANGDFMAFLYHFVCPSEEDSPDLFSTPMSVGGSGEELNLCRGELMSVESSLCWSDTLEQTLRSSMDESKGFDELNNSPRDEVPLLLDCVMGKGKKS